MNPPVTQSAAAAEKPAGTQGPGKPADGRIAFVGAGPGDEGLLTLRAADLLARADLVVAGPELAERLGGLVRPEATTADADALAQDPRMLVKAAKAGQHVVRLFSGDPFLFGHAAPEVAACAKARVPFEVVPGVPTATAVPAYAGIPLTSDTSGDVRVIHASEVSRVQAGPGSLVILGAETGPVDLAKMLIAARLGRHHPVRPHLERHHHRPAHRGLRPRIGHRRPQGRRREPAHRPRARGRRGR